MKKLFVLGLLLSSATFASAQGNMTGTFSCGKLNVCSIPAANIVGTIPAGDLDGTAIAPATIFVGSTPGALIAGSVVTSSGSVILQSTTTTATHKIFSVRNYAGSDLFYLMQGGNLVLPSGIAIAIGGTTIQNGVDLNVNNKMMLNGSSNRTMYVTQNMGGANYFGMGPISATSYGIMYSGSAGSTSGTPIFQTSASSATVYGDMNVQGNISGSTFTFTAGKGAVTIDTATFSGWMHLPIVISTMAGASAGAQTVANCPAGYSALSGGCQCTGGTALTTTLNLPVDGVPGTLVNGGTSLGVGWYCRAQGTVGATCDAFAVCIKAGP